MELGPGVCVTFVLGADDATRLASDLELEVRGADDRVLVRRTRPHGQLGWSAEVPLWLPPEAVLVDARTTTGRRGATSLVATTPFDRIELPLH